jgi:hypothetical protein
MDGFRGMTPAFNLHASEICDDLVRDDGWRPWGYECYQGRIFRATYDLNGNRASASELDPSYTFEAAREAYNIGDYDGMCHWLNPEMTGIRFDDVSELAPNDPRWLRVQSNIESLDSMTEWAPRGTAIGVIVRATVGEDRHFPRSKFTVFRGRRFFTVTGWNFRGISRPIAERQEELEHLMARASLLEARRSTLILQLRRREK